MDHVPFTFILVSLSRNNFELVCYSNGWFLL
jgi:hypothetical protein